MTSIEIRDSRLSDVKELIKTLRLKDRLESERMGFAPEVSLKYSYKNAVYRKTALIDGQIAAMWGVVGTLTSNHGHPYLVTSVLVETIPSISFVRIYRHEVYHMNLLFKTLENYVDATYLESVRLLQLTGFTVHPANDLKFRKFTRTTL